MKENRLMALHSEEAIDNSPMLSKHWALQLYKLSSNSSMELHKVNYETLSGREPKLQQPSSIMVIFQEKLFVSTFHFTNFYSSDGAKQQHPRVRSMISNAIVYETPSRVCKALHILETTLNMNVVCFFWHWWFSKRNYYHGVFSFQKGRSTLGYEITIEIIKSRLMKFLFSSILKIYEKIILYNRFLSLHI